MSLYVCNDLCYNSTKYTIFFTIYLVKVCAKLQGVAALKHQLAIEIDHMIDQRALDKVMCIARESLRHVLK